MWRYLAAGGALLAICGAAALLMFGAVTHSAAPMPEQPVQRMTADTTADATADDASVPEASAKTREEKRFGRYDKDRDGKVTRDEYLASRRKAFAKLDVNGDGRLDFEEWASKASAKFAAADRDKSGAMTPAEFATTAAKRKPHGLAKCPPSAAPAADDGQN